MQKIALITGATSGIGQATALTLAEKGLNLIITGRRESRLHELKEVLETKGVSVLPLCFDVRNETEVNEALLNLPEAWKNVDILINNAGLAAGLDSIQEGNTDNWNSMIDTNMKGLLFVTRNIAPGMVKRKYGQIINIGSISSKEVYLTAMYIVLPNMLWKQ